MKKWSCLLWLLGLLSLWSCEETNPHYQADMEKAEYFHRAMQQLSDVIVHDIFSPPVASRIYVYASIAGYEALQAGYPEYQSLAGQLNELKPGPMPEAGKTYCYPLASLEAFLMVGKTFTFSEDKMEAFKEEFYAELQATHMPDDVWDRSIAYGQAVAKHILGWADQDNYKQTRTFPKYSVTNDPARWQPTAPDYMDGIEPHWREIRPLVLDSAQQFKPLPPTAFDLNQNSPFMKEVMEVYSALKVEEETEREERHAIASFWDCNPYVSHHAGHMMFATKKITPGGHWVGITKIACEKTNASCIQSLEAYTLTCISLFDGFISCWDEKYRSNLVRPVTVINDHVDENWIPLLQTPPFPEYTSGHSVISRAAATALTAVFGDPFEFLDTTEEAYGLPARSFQSFYEASDEAAVSRLYGGIHYRPAIDQGVKQGEKVGRRVVERVQMKAQLSNN